MKNNSYSHKEFLVLENTISHGGICKECGWTVIKACCNQSFTEFKDAGDWDWWVYCSNKGCSHHDGEGVFQNKIEWVG